MNTIYEPRGRAKEYGELALNIYTGCTHGCTYCYAPAALRKSREQFHTTVQPRKNIVEETKKHLHRSGMTGQTVHLCFTCDPYPAGVDTTPTREIIQAIKDSGNHVQLLTKGGHRAERDFDLLDGDDWFGVTISGNEDQMAEMEPGAAARHERLESLLLASQRGIKTWVSLEPVFCTQEVYHTIVSFPFIDRYKIGKLNHQPSSINWAEFGRECERLCQELDRDYYIKQDLRDCMEVSQ